MKQSELLRKQADMIDLAEKHGIDNWKEMVRYKHEDRWFIKVDETLNQSDVYQFALGVVEGQPVFAGDTLYTANGTAYTAKEGEPVIGGTWTKPKPSTILVELLVEDAEWAANNRSYFPYARISDSCRRALESIK